MIKDRITFAHFVVPIEGTCSVPDRRKMLWAPLLGARPAEASVV